jgi:hypothetical protein
MVRKEEFIKKFIINIEKILREELPDSGTLDEMYEVVRTILQRRLYFLRRK